MFVRQIDIPLSAVKSIFLSHCISGLNCVNAANIGEDSMCKDFSSMTFFCNRHHFAFVCWLLKSAWLAHEHTHLTCLLLRQHLTCLLLRHEHPCTRLACYSDMNTHYSTYNYLSDMNSTSMITPL